MRAKSTARATAIQMLRSHREAEGDQHGTQIQRIACECVWPGHGKLSILFDVSGGVSAQPDSGNYKNQAQRDKHKGRPGQPEIKHHEGKAHGHADALCDFAPAALHYFVSLSNSIAASSTASGVMVNRPASGSAWRA